ncbi:MAG: hypothetical protein E7675_01160 [Ruminococcaceae bacterium]|nr:hypothetical protein [Oscillospiraceae bacterium]
MNEMEKPVDCGFNVTVTEAGRRLKPLCELEDGLLCYKKGTFGILDQNGKWIPKIKHIAGIKGLLGKFRPFERVLRMTPRCAQALGNKSAIVSHSGGVLYVDLKSNTVTLEHTYCSGMSNPLSFARVQGIEGFDSGIYYGEYTGNPEGREVAIYRRPIEDRGCSWEKVYEFPKGSITHIHAIVPDKYRRGVIVMTGDSDKASGIYLFTDNFKSVITVAGGSQQSRSCVAFPREEGIFFATDTPHQQNHLYLACENNGVWTQRSIADLDGSCIYGAETEKYMLFNTVVETDSTKKDLRLLFTYKRGNGIADWYTKVYLSEGQGICQQVLKYKKDILPMGLCQFGSVSFCPSSEKDTLWISPVAVKKYDGRLMKLKIEKENK